MIFNRRCGLALCLAVAFALTSAGRGAAQDDTASPLLSATLDALPPLPALIEVARLTLAAGAGVEQTVPGPEMYGVEAGTLGVRVDAESVLTRMPTDDAPLRPEVAEPGIDYTLHPGDQILVPAGVGHLLFNDGQESASFFNAVIFSSTAAAPSWLPGAASPPGVSRVPLASDFVADPADFPSGRVQVTLTRLTVAAGADLPPLATQGLALVVVEDGILTIADGGSPETNIGAGEVARLTLGGASSRLRSGSDAPLVAFVLIIDEHHPDAQPSDD